MISLQKYKSLWDFFSDALGTTIFHPQYFAKKYAWEAVEISKKEAHGVLLDIGCGRMPYRDLLLPQVEKYIGLDHPTTAKLYHGKKGPDIYADATKIPLKSGSVDTILMLMVLEHLPDPALALREVKRLLKPGGVFIGSTVQMYPLHDEPHDFFRYTRYAIKNLLTQSDFRSKKIRSRGGFYIFLSQSINVYLFKTLRKMLRKRYSAIPALFLLPFFYILSIISNIVALGLSPLDREEESLFNITHTFLAKTQT